jgi:hypothetical protein
MKFKDYITKLNNLMENYPAAGELETCCASDDEGNSFGPVNFEPTVGRLDGNDFESDAETPNAVCIN